MMGSQSSDTSPVLPHSAGKRILLVEDHHETATSLKLALEDLGYVVALAHNGPVALQVAKDFAPDVCLLDIVLPVMDGYELLRRMRESQAAEHQVHYIAVTGHGMQFDRKRSLAAGCVEHMLKPVRVHALVRVIEEIFTTAIR